VNSLVICDTETFGLSAQNDPILEVGFGIYNLFPLSLKAEWSSVVWMDSYRPRMDSHRDEDSFIWQMHKKSGLWDECIRVSTEIDVTPYHVEGLAAEWLHEQGVSKDDPMVGSSVQFDREMLREQMPEIEKLFSYRNIDISTIKELCRRLNPELYTKLDLEVTNKKAHRVMDDIEDTANELEFYMTNFLFIGDELF